MAKGKYKKRNQQSTETQEQVVQQEQPKSRETLIEDMARLDFENQAEHEKAGKDAPTYGFWGWVYRMQQKYGKKETHLVNKKTYIWLAVLTGWMGGHRFYEKRYVVASLYLLFFWTFVPLTMVVIDIMAVIPKQSNEDGMIEL